MLKPNAKKVADHAELEAMVAAYKQRGGVIEKQPDGVSKHLRKTRYVGRSAMRGVGPRLGQ